jgi:hypothetical protein
MSLKLVAFSEVELCGALEGIDPPTEDRGGIKYSSGASGEECTRELNKRGSLTNAGPTCRVKNAHIIAGFVVLPVFWGWRLLA